MELTERFVEALLFELLVGPCEIGFVGALHIGRGDVSKGELLDVVLDALRLLGRRGVLDVPVDGLTLRVLLREALVVGGLLALRHQAVLLSGLLVGAIDRRHVLSGRLRNEAAARDHRRADHAVLALLLELVQLLRYPVGDRLGAAVLDLLKQILAQPLAGIALGVGDGEQRLAGVQDVLLHLGGDVHRPDFLTVVQRDRSNLGAPLLHVLVHELGDLLVILDPVALVVLVRPPLGLHVRGRPCEPLVAALRC